MFLHNAIINAVSIQKFKSKVYMIYHYIEHHETRERTASEMSRVDVQYDRHKIGHSRSQLIIHNYILLCLSIICIRHNGLT